MWGIRPPLSSSRRSRQVAIPPILPICRSRMARSGAFLAHRLPHLGAAGELADRDGGVGQGRAHLGAHQGRVADDEHLRHAPQGSPPGAWVAFQRRSRANQGDPRAPHRCSRRARATRSAVPSGSLTPTRSASSGRHWANWRPGRSCSSTCPRCPSSTPPASAPSSAASAGPGRSGATWPCAATGPRSSASSTPPASTASSPSPTPSRKRPARYRRRREGSHRQQLTGPPEAGYGMQNPVPSGWRPSGQISSMLGSGCSSATVEVVVGATVDRSLGRRRHLHRGRRGFRRRHRDRVEVDDDEVDVTAGATVRLTRVSLVTDTESSMASEINPDTAQARATSESAPRNCSATGSDRSPLHQLSNDDPTAPGYACGPTGAPASLANT